MQPLVNVNISNFIFQIINTLIIFWVLKGYLFGPVTTFMENRRKSIEDSIKIAEGKNQEADNLKADYQRKLDGIKEERNEIIKDATRRADQRGEEIIKKAELEAKKITDKANLDIERERQKALNELKTQMSELVMLAAAKVVEKELDSTQHHVMIKQFIDEVGEAKWQN